MNIKKLVCLGDSITEGYMLDPQYRWSDLLSHKCDCEILNRGISGDTTAGMLSRLYADVLIEKPSHVIFLGGTNDLSFNIDDNLILSNIHSIVRQLRYKNIEMILGIITPYFPSISYKENVPAKELLLRDRIHSFQNTLKQYALDEGRSIIDFSQCNKPN